MNSIILSYVTFVYFGSFLLYLLMMVIGKSVFGRLATFMTSLGVAAHTLAIVLRWVESYRFGIGHAPLTNFYESLIFFAWALMLLYLLIEWRTKNRSIGTFAAPMAFLIMAYASFSSISSHIEPLIPALRNSQLF